MKLKPKHAHLIASGDLRLNANRVCWPEQEKMEAALGRALAAEGWKIQRTHVFDRAKGHGFIDSPEVLKEELASYKAVMPKKDKPA